MGPARTGRERINDDITKAIRTIKFLYRTPTLCQVKYDVYNTIKKKKNVYYIN